MDRNGQRAQKSKLSTKHCGISSADSKFKLVPEFLSSPQVTTERMLARFIFYYTNQNNQIILLIPALKVYIRLFVIIKLPEFLQSRHLLCRFIQLCNNLPVGCRP